MMQLIFHNFHSQHHVIFIYLYVVADKINEKILQPPDHVCVMMMVDCMFYYLPLSAGVKYFLGAFMGRYYYYYFFEH